jgi:hypothetical protein
VRVNFFLPTAFAPTLRISRASSGRRQKKEEALGASPVFFRGNWNRPYFNSTWSPISIIRLESMTRAMAHRSPM